MAGPHLERLRAQKSQKRAVEAPPKPSKPGFGGFGGDQSTHFLENLCLAEGDDAAVENLKSATTAHRQNLQNLNSPSVPATASPHCRVEAIELPQAQRYRKVFAHLQLKPPALVPVDRWQQCVRDGSRFLAAWGTQAEALGWSSADLFGLHTPPDKPHPSYQRLSRYDETGLIWLLEGRTVVALTVAAATIRNSSDTGAITTYRRFNKPALGPIGESLVPLILNDESII
jgi:hypothetical protein